jgi:hypothetical protein
VSTRPAIPLRRLFLLTVVTAAVAFAVDATLAAAGAPYANTISLAVVPVAAGVIIFLGLRPYPLGGRLRMALMTAVALFLVGLGL